MTAWRRNLLRCLSSFCSSDFVWSDKATLSCRFLWLQPWREPWLYQNSQWRTLLWRPLPQHSISRSCRCGGKEPFTVGLLLFHYLEEHQHLTKEHQHSWGQALAKLPLYGVLLAHFESTAPVCHMPSEREHSSLHFTMALHCYSTESRTVFNTVAL